jgi:hypothetical protein
LDRATTTGVVGGRHECRIDRREENPMAEAYCVKCKAKREVKNPEQITMKNGKHALKGTCPVCGTSVFKIGG